MNQQRQTIPTVINLCRSHSLGVNSLLSCMKAHPWYLERLYHERSAPIETMTHCDVVDNKDLEIGARHASLMVNDPKLASDVRSRFATINNISDISLWHRGRVIAALEYKSTKSNIWTEQSAFPIVTSFINQKLDYLHKYNRMCDLDWTLYVITDSRGDEIFSSNQYAESIRALWGRQVAFEMRRPHHKPLYNKTTMSDMCSTVLPEFMTQMQRYMMRHAPAQSLGVWQFVDDEVSRAADQDVPDYTLDQQITVNETQMSLKFAEDMRKATQSVDVVKVHKEEEEEEAEVEAEEDESRADKKRQIGVDQIIDIVTERLKSVATESDPHGFTSMLSRIEGSAEMYDVFKLFSDAEAVDAFYELGGSRLTESYLPATRATSIRLMRKPIVRVIASITIVARNKVRQNELHQYWRKFLFADMVFNIGSKSSNAMYRIVQVLQTGTTTDMKKDPHESSLDESEFSKSRSIESVVESAMKVLETVGEDTILCRFEEDVRLLYQKLCAIEGEGLVRRSKICAACNIRFNNLAPKTAEACLNSRAALLSLAIFLAESNRSKSAKLLGFQLIEFNLPSGSARKFNTLSLIMRRLVKR